VDKEIILAESLPQTTERLSAALKIDGLEYFCFAVLLG
jgi:hypothetical protein